MSRNTRVYVAITLAVFALQGCSGLPRSGGQTSAPGGYYKDDGPGEDIPPDLDAIPDAQPRLEVLHKHANKPYTVLGRAYTPSTTVGSYREVGKASWYGRKFHGQKTSSGEIYDMYAMTAAHPTLPIPSYARITNQANGKTVVVRINDRGPFHGDRLVDLSYTAAHKLGILRDGSAAVEVRSIALLSADPPVATFPAAQDPETEIAEIHDDPGIYLQLGAFGARYNAEAFAGRVRAQLGEIAERVQVLLRMGLYQVHLGPYPDRAAATRAADELVRQLSIQSILVKP
ncbi:MAG: septal ring lytic transglycosylase RlpA family protein [Burkholderiales bacterium]